MNFLLFFLLLALFAFCSAFSFRLRLNLSEHSRKFYDSQALRELLFVALVLLFADILGVFGGPFYLKFLFFTLLVMVLFSLRSFLFFRSLQSLLHSVREDVSSRDKIREGVFDFCDGLVREVMVPLNDVFKIPSDITVWDIVSNEHYRSYSRIPVYQGEKDNIIGIVYVKEILKLCHNLSLPEIRKFSIKPYVTTPMYVPEVMETAFLLREFQRRKIHMAIVVDEYGVTTGIVTFEDLMEIIVGEIQDMRNDNSDSLVRQLKSTEWIFDAMMDLEDFSELVEHDFDSDSVETIGGFVFEQVGALPEVGSRIVCDDFEFHVLEMEGYRIRKIKVVKVSS